MDANEITEINNVHAMIPIIPKKGSEKGQKKKAKVPVKIEPNKAPEILLRFTRLIFSLIRISNSSGVKFLSEEEGGFFGIPISYVFNLPVVNHNSKSIFCRLYSVESPELYINILISHF